MSNSVSGAGTAGMVSGVATWHADTPTMLPRSAVPAADGATPEAEAPAVDVVYTTRPPDRTLAPSAARVGWSPIAWGRLAG